MRGLNRYEVHIVEDNFYARDALAMYCAKHENLSVRSVTSFARMGSGTYEWSRRSDTAVSSIALVSHDNARVIRNALIWFEANLPDALVVVLLSKPTEANVKASMSALTRGIVCADEVGFAIGEVISSCTQERFIATAKVIPHLFSQSESSRPTKPTVVGTGKPFESISQSTGLTMHMFCAWGMSNEQIARHFGISQNTIASRIKAGYLAMDVGCRHEATQALLTSVSGL